MQKHAAVSGIIVHTVSCDIQGQGALSYSVIDRLNRTGRSHVPPSIVIAIHCDGGSPVILSIGEARGEE